MLYIDTKFASMLSPRLRNFKQQKDYLWNFSCPICGDSSKNKLKARAYIYRKKQELYVKCHNCGYGSNIGNLIKHMDERLYDEYSLERYESTAKPKVSHKKVEAFDVFKQDSGLDTTKVPLTKDSLVDSMISVIDGTDVGSGWVRKYLAERAIPREKMELLYWVPKFKEWTNANIDDKFVTPIREDHPRLVIPFFNAHGKIDMVNCRAFGNEQPKYYSLKIDPESPKIFGLERFDYSKQGYVVEGPLDSLFLPNTLAVAGSTLDTEVIWSIKSMVTLIPDNEPRNKEIVKQIKKYIDRGYRVCLWPNGEGKDINDMVLSGWDVAKIIDTIEKNSYTGLEAEATFSEWKKC